MKSMFKIIDNNFLVLQVSIRVRSKHRVEKHRIRILGEIYDILFHKMGKYKLKLRVNRMFRKIITF